MNWKGAFIILSPYWSYYDENIDPKGDVVIWLEDVCSS